VDNRQLIRAREVSRSGTPAQGGTYRWLHGMLRGLIEQAAPGPSAVDPGYAAHVLLGALRPDLIDEMLASGDSPEAVRGAQADFVRRILA
jgi:hypothetical protein